VLQLATSRILGFVDQQKHFAGLSHFAQLTFMVDWDSETNILLFDFHVNTDSPSKK